MYLLVTARKGISSMQLAKEIGVTQKTAWFMLSRLREAYSDPDSQDKLKGVIEIDECFIGGKEANKHERKKLKAGRGPVGKIAVLGTQALAPKYLFTFSRWIDTIVRPAHLPNMFLKSHHRRTI